MTASQRATLVFNNNEHYLDALIKLSATGPQIGVEVGDIDFDFDGVVFSGPEQAMVDAVNSRTIVFYKFNGKYIVLGIGRETLKAAMEAEIKPTTIKGRFVSVPMLKKSRIPLPFVEPDPVTTAVFARKPYLGNHPRIVDTRERFSREEHPSADKRGGTGFNRGNR